MKREIDAENKTLAKDAKVERGFINQLRNQASGKQPTKAVRESGEFKSFQGEQQVERAKEITPNCSVDPDKTSPSEPNQGFSDQIDWNAGRKGVK